MHLLVAYSSCTLILEAAPSQDPSNEQGYAQFAEQLKSTLAKEPGLAGMLDS